MSMNPKVITYGAPAESIWAYKQDIESHAQTIKADETVVKVEGNQKVIKAGTVYPTNDANAKGIVRNTYYTDTDSDMHVALAFKGVIKANAKLPEAISEEALKALPMITVLKSTTPKY